MILERLASTTKIQRMKERRSEPLKDIIRASNK